ncbi:MAG: hypothetical protein JRI61_10215 [Deltaproteobacteria bacterium]|nr:hypothetical protein [Deltaproteobacteria bacterium]
MGRLQNKNQVYTITTYCANSERKIQIELDGDLNISNVSKGSDLFYSMALMNTDRMKETSIVDVF